MIGLLLSLLLITQNDAHAEPRRSAYLGAGLILQNMGEVTNNINGSTNLSGSQSLAIIGSARIGGSSWLLAPAVTFMPINTTDSDNGSYKNITTLAFSIAKRFDWLELRAGPGVFWYAINGRGGTVTLDNGNDTAIFYKPINSASSRLFMLQGGLGVEFSKIRTDLDTWIVEAFSSSRRSFNMLISVSYGVL
jgi:hypothetical protein